MFTVRALRTRPLSLAPHLVSSCCAPLPSSRRVIPARVRMASSAASGSTTAASPPKATENTQNGKQTATSKPATSAAVPSLELTALSPTVYIYRPPVKSASDKSSEDGPSFLRPLTPRQSATIPRVILIMGWMNAPLRLVTKYAAPYALLFPNATIVIQLSTGVTFIKNRKEHDAGFQHIIDVLKQSQESMRARSALHSQVRDLQDSSAQAGMRLDVDTQNTLAREATKESSDTNQKVPEDYVGEDGGVIIHSFSDGGAFNVSQLLNRIAYQDVPPPLAHIMDSSPGKASPYSGSTALTMSLVKRPWLRAVVRTALYIYLFLLYGFKRLIGATSWSDALRRALNSPRKWDWRDKGIESRDRNVDSSTSSGAMLPPRCYLYSRSDALIDYRAVEEHAREAAKLHGLPAPKQVLSLPDPKAGADARTVGAPERQVVALRRWEGVQHCDIGRADFEGYWTAVRRFLSAVL